MDPATVASLATLGTVLGGFAFQAWREERKRKWEVQDREALAAKVIVEANAVALRVEEVAKKVIIEAKAVALKVIENDTLANTQRKKLMEAIDLNTDISTKAFHEANSVNQKIQKLGIEHNALQRETKAVEAKENNPV